MPSKKKKMRKKKNKRSKKKKKLDYRLHCARRGAAFYSLLIRSFTVYSQRIHSPGSWYWDAVWSVLLLLGAGPCACIL